MRCGCPMERVSKHRALVFQDSQQFKRTNWHRFRHSANGRQTTTTKGQLALASRKLSSFVEQLWTTRLVKCLHGCWRFLAVVRQVVLHKQPLSWWFGVASSRASKTQEVPGNYKCKHTQERQCWKFLNMKKA